MYCAHSCNPFFGGDPRPPYLRRTEEPRFIRTAYQLWGLCLFDPERRKLRFKSRRYLPGKRLVPAEELGDDTSDEEIMG